MLTFLFHYKYISLNKSSSPAGFCFCLFFILMYLTFQSRSNLSCSIAFQCTLFFQVFFLIVQLGGKYSGSAHLFCCHICARREEDVWVSSWANIRIVEWTRRSWCIYLPPPSRNWINICTLVNQSKNCWELARVGSLNGG